MIAMAPIAGPGFAAALALTALLAVTVRPDPLLLWDLANTAPRASWLPWLAMAGLAVASAVFGVTHPLEFAAAYGQNLLDPGTPAVVLSGP